MSQNAASLSPTLPRPMPPSPPWQPDRDAVLRRLRTEGHTWAAIGTELGVSREAARERGRRIGAIRLPPPPPPVPDISLSANRPPLPAGHPLSWGLLTSGTVLAGDAYPLPVFV